MHHRLLPLCLALWLTAALTGCGGGSGGAVPTGPGQTPPPSGSNWPQGQVLAWVTDRDGQPVAGAVVRMVQSTGEYVDGPTNAEGAVLFVNVPAGKASVRAEGWGYYISADQEVQVVERTQVAVAFALEPRNAATPVVLGTRVINKDAGGGTLQFEIDVAVLDESGQPITNLVDASFGLPPIDCGWGPCVVGPSGMIDVVYDPGSGRPQAFGLEPARNRSPVAAGILLDQGDAMRSSEPQRSAALGEFLAGLTGSDSVLLAEFRGSGSSLSFVPSGGFITDGRGLLPLAQGLPGRIDDRSSDPVAALDLMLSHLEQQPSTRPKALVAITRGEVGCDQPTPPQGWLPSCRRLVERSRALGIPVTTLSSPFSVSGADLSGRTGGAAFFIEFPTQYRTALRGLFPVITGEAPYYRMRFSVRVDALEEGNTLLVYLEVRPSDRDRLYADIVVPL